MRIKKRTIATNATRDETPSGKFPFIEAKPKKDVPDTGMFANQDTIPPKFARMLGNLSYVCGDTPSDIPLSVADRFKLLRTPYDTTTATESRYRNRVRNRQTAITAMCIVCTGSRKLVTECADLTCPLWAFRFGTNPYRGKK